MELADVGDVRLVEVVPREDHDAGDRQGGLKVNPNPGLSKKKYFCIVNPEKQDVKLHFL